MENFVGSEVPVPSPTMVAVTEVALPAPSLVMMMGTAELVVLTVISPNPALEGAAESAGPCPVPVRVRVFTGVTGSFVLISTVAVLVPSAVGENVASNVLLPEVISQGRADAGVSAKSPGFPAPSRVMLYTLSVPVPVFVTVVESAADELPIATGAANVCDVGLSVQTGAMPVPLSVMVEVWFETPSL